MSRAGRQARERRISARQVRERKASIRQAHERRISLRKAHERVPSARKNWLISYIQRVRENIIDQWQTFRQDIKPSSIASGSHHSRPLGVYPVLLLIMAAVLFLGLSMLSNSLILVTRGVSTTGTITSYIPATTSSFCRSSDDYTVLFVTTDVHRTIMIDETVPSCLDKYHRGDTVAVLYDPRDPQHARVATFFNLWEISGLATIGGLGGCLMGGIGTTAFIIRTRQRRRLKKQAKSQSS